MRKCKQELLRLASTIVESSPDDASKDANYAIWVSCCLGEWRYLCLEEDVIDTTIDIMTNYLMEHKNSVSEESVKLVVRIIDRELNNCGCDDNSCVEALLDAFFKVTTIKQEQDLLWQKIDENADNHKKFRRWAGRRRFDLSKHNKCKCSGCHRTLECALVPVPADDLGKSDYFPFCRECYGEWFYAVNDEETVPSNRKTYCRNDMFPNGIDDGFTIE